MEGLANAAAHEDRHTPLKNYCKGLLLPGDRKSMEPMAARLDPDNIQPMRQSLHHLVAKAPWTPANNLFHELGHADAFMGDREGRNVGSSYQHALDFENQVRRLRDPNAPIRIQH